MHKVSKLFAYEVLPSVVVSNLTMQIMIPMTHAFAKHPMSLNCL